MQSTYAVDFACRALVRINPSPFSSHFLGKKKDKEEEEEEKENPTTSKQNKQPKIEKRNEFRGVLWLFQMKIILIVSR